MLSDSEKTTSLISLLRDDKAVLVVVHQQGRFIAVVHSPVTNGHILFQSQGQDADVAAAIEAAVHAFQKRPPVILMSQGGDA